MGSTPSSTPGRSDFRGGSEAPLVRVEDQRGLSAIHLASSTDRITGCEVNEFPLLASDPGNPACEWGFEDARISFVPFLDHYVMTCTAYGPPRPCVFLATSNDLTSIDTAEEMWSWFWQEALPTSGCHDPTISSAGDSRSWSGAPERAGGGTQRG